MTTARAVLARELPPARLLYAGWWAALLGLVAALVFGANVVVLTLMVAVSIAVVLAPRARAVGPSGTTHRVLAAVLAAGTAVMLVLSAMSLTADLRLRSGQSSGDLAKLDSAASIAPWHAAAQYLATYASATDAVASLVQGMPGGQEAATSAKDRLAELVNENPHDYASSALQAYVLTQMARSKALQQSNRLA